MKLLSPAISSLARMRMWRIDAWKNNPIEAQRDVLQNLVTAAQYTEIGRQYNFSELFTVRAFKQAVPILEYGKIEKERRLAEKLINSEGGWKIFNSFYFSGTTRWYSNRNKYPPYLKISCWFGK